MGLLFWKKKRKSDSRPAEEQQDGDLAFVPRREELRVPDRENPAVFEFPSPSGEGMTGLCNIEPADNISACIWQLQEPQAPSEERKDQKPLYHIEF
ncbi:g1236 [Coccomyxa viridis]|uniref:G1236 protein n=1 Tax=Coccomyxa viridis TaxID=1274662 RepID=A0ABP1FHJ2_9CHLO